MPLDKFADASGMCVCGSRRPDFRRRADLELQSSTKLFHATPSSALVFLPQQRTMLRVAVVRGNVGLEQVLRTGVRRQWQPQWIRQPVKVRASNVLREEH
jgi:hypothetical protein